MPALTASGDCASEPSGCTANNMKIIISPAKRMEEDPYGPAPLALPAFLPQALRLQAALRRLSSEELQRLWQCGDAIAQKNVAWLAHMTLTQPRSAALFSFQGIQYRYMAPNVLTGDQLDYLQANLRIVSGLYGLLRPLDGVVPYRLEMQAKLPVDGHRNLYGFWGARLGRALAGETSLVLDLASREYSSAVLPHLPPSVTCIRCTFGQLRAGRVVEKGTLCKMARGRMVRWLAEERISRPGDLAFFSQLGYRFSPQHSTPDHYVFLAPTQTAPEDDHVSDH